MLKTEIIPVELATELLEEYRSGSSNFWSSPNHTLIAWGEYARLEVREESNQLTLPERVKGLLAATKKSGHDVPIVIGAIPFDDLNPAELIVPMTTKWAGPLRFDGDVQDAEALTSGYVLYRVPEKERYVDSVNQVLLRLAQDELQKVVLSRSLHIELPTVVDTQRLLCNLARHNTCGYTFGIHISKSDMNEKSNLSECIGARTLVGASPELLVTKEGIKIKANPLAGSAARSADPIEDKRRAALLLTSKKDLYEHFVVVEAVEAALRPYCKTLEIPTSPSIVQTDSMWHLSTEITGELANSETSALELAMALHPTPAICGTPTNLAKDVIKEIEPFERGFFTGLVGWCDANGDGEWAVTIRCAEVEYKSLRLYAGAGVVNGSSGEAEFAETSAKLQTMCKAIGLLEQTEEHREG